MNFANFSNRPSIAPPSSLALIPEASADDKTRLSADFVFLIEKRVIRCGDVASV